MSRPVRIGLFAATGLLGLIVVLLLAGISILRSEWFFHRVRAGIVNETEKATGGKVELRDFRFDWRKLVAEADGLVIHGTEPAGAAPLFRAARVSIGIKVISLSRHDVDISFVDVLQPEANLIIAADGSTNLPEPKVPRKAGEPIEQIILDLAIGRFSAQNGTLTISAAERPHKIFPWNLEGRNLATTFSYAPNCYSGKISIAPLRAGYGTYGPVDASLDLAATFERGRLQVSRGTLATAASRIDFTGDLQNLAAPSIAGEYTAHLGVAEAGRIAHVAALHDGVVDSSGHFEFGEGREFHITGKLKGTNLGYRDRDLQLSRLQISSAFAADEKQIDFTDLRTSLAGGGVTGRLTVTDLRGATPERFRAAGTISKMDIYAIAALLKENQPPFDARVSGPFEASGTFAGLSRGRFNGNARLTITPEGSVPLNGEVDAAFDGSRQVVNFDPSWLTLPSTRLEFSGSLGVQPKSTAANLQVRLGSRDLKDLLAVAPEVKDLPLDLQNGHAEFDGTVTGDLASPAIAGHFTANNVTVEKELIEAVSADIAASADQLQVRKGTLGARNMRGQISGTLGLHQWKPNNHLPLTASASFQNADIANLLALVGQPQIPVKGSLTAQAQVNGTLADPHATATLRGEKGSAWNEPFDRFTANVTYVNDGRQDVTAEVDSGSRKINLTGSFQHSPTDFLDGVIRAQAKSNDVVLNQVQIIRNQQPGLAGVAHATADTEIRMVHAKAGVQFQIVRLNADVGTRNLTLDQKPLGDLHLAAHTISGPAGAPLLAAQLETRIAGSAIRGSGTFGLTGDYSGSGELTFSQVDLADLRKLVNPTSTALAAVGGSLEGKVTFNGSLSNPRAMSGTIEIPKFEIKPQPGEDDPIPVGLRDLVIRNQGEIRARMNNGIIRVEAARVTARSTDITVAGNINLNANAPLNLRASGNLDLSIVPMFVPDVVSSGTVAAFANIRGTFNQPEVTGRLDVAKANFNFEGLPNGLSNANGQILFDGTRATIQSLSAETGGGKINLTGFVTFASGPLTFRLEADAKEVRVRYPEGVSTVADADLRLIGTSDRSTLSGTVTVVRSAFNTRTDLGGLLANAAAPVQTPAVQTTLAGNMQFDVDIRTAPDVSLQTSLAQGLQADANLRLRGTLSNPVLLGRVNINQGNLTFFGNKYSINEGTISFYNPVKLEPVLNVSLQTRARGVDVTINVTGPISKLNVSYRSDPPLQFSDLVALLATGRTPNNPTLAARETGPPQTWQEMGASALVGEAIANPLAGRLQRFFGVSKIKIDPLLTGVAGNAQARVTIEENVTPDLTLTYITSVAGTTGSAQVIRAEWNFSRHWSAVAVRDEYGYFGIDFQYRKRFK